MPSPSWANHNAIFSAVGMEVGAYAYYVKATCGFDFEGAKADIKVSVASMRKSCDVTDVVKTFRKHTEACPIDLINFDWNQSAIPAGISGFTECSDNVCDVTRFSHCGLPS